MFPSTALGRGKPQPSASSAFLDAVKTRRTIYKISNEPIVSDERIKEIVNHAITHVPSSFNSQSTRVLVLVKGDHEKLWDLAGDILKPLVPPDMWQWTQAKMEGFRAGYGTVLFFEDPQPVKALQEQYPLFAANFPTWAEHTSAMHQFVLWTALSAEGYGASLQHYNPLIDQRVLTEWNLPLEWSLKAQLVFGKPVGGPDEKTFQPLEERIKFVGMSDVNRSKI